MQLLKQHWLLIVFGIVVLIVLKKASDSTGGVTISNTVQPIQLPPQEDRQYKFGQLAASYGVEMAQINAQSDLAKQAVELAKYQADTNYDITQLQQVYGLSQARAYYQSQANQFDLLGRYNLEGQRLQSQTQISLANQQAATANRLIDSQKRHWYDSLLGGIGSGLGSLFAFL